MIFTETALPGAFVIDLERREDERGFFARAFCQREFSELELATHLVQTNVAYSRRRGTLRGLHFQVAPHQEAKLIRCVAGALYDVIVDLRPTSPTFKEWTSVVLTPENRRTLYVPKGFAHGYQTLADRTEMLYHMSEFYAPECERGVRYDDPAFGIHWPDVDERLLSEKDRSWGRFVDEQMKHSAMIHGEASRFAGENE